MGPKNWAVLRPLIARSISLFLLLKNLTVNIHQIPVVFTGRLFVPFFTLAAYSCR